jgi:hypothetical protein
MQSHTLCIALVSPAEKNLRIITPSQKILSDIFPFESGGSAGRNSRKKEIKNMCFTPPVELLSA